MDKSASTAYIKSVAQQLGFTHIGISKAEYLQDEAPRLEEWLKRHYHGEMQYMENYFDIRLDPRKLVDNAKSVISLTYNYFTNEKLAEDSYKISTYAFGEDYHLVVKDKLNQLLENIKNKIGNINGRVFVDSAPILERAWAVKSGIGWIGKHSLLINKQHGSFFFLAEIVLDIELEYDATFNANHCGTCTACIDACPTDAIVADKVVDGSKCISYLTIELKNEIPTSFQDKMEDWIYGCDICQDVCPWNRFAQQHHEPKFNLSSALEKMTKKEWHEMSDELFQHLFKKSPVKRTKYLGLSRNISFIEKKIVNN